MIKKTSVFKVLTWLSRCEAVLAGKDAAWGIEELEEGGRGRGNTVEHLLSLPRTHWEMMASAEDLLLISTILTERKNTDQFNCREAELLCPTAVQDIT